MADAFPAGFVRCVTGDADPARLGACDAHEHLAIAGAFVEARWPDYLLDEPARLVGDLRDFRTAGGGWLVDAMPTGAGRSVRRLVELSAETGVSIVAATGVHLPIYYPDEHPLLRMGAAGLTEVFVREIEAGVDDGDGLVCDRRGRPVRAGVIKVAGDRPKLSAFQR
ncbi:MAG: hypothetical protein AAGE65_13795, partial [Planctomycetota bacterium]